MVSFKPHGIYRVEAAQAALEETTRKLAELNQQRNKLLLEDNDSEAAKLGAEIEALQHTARVHEDKIVLLKAAAEQEAHEKRLREREAQNKRIDLLFDHRSEIAKKLAGCKKQETALWRQLLALTRQIVAAHNWTPSDLSACLLGPSAVNGALAHESYRVSYTPRLLGGQVEAPDAGLSLPDSRVPRHELRDLPERILPMADAFHEAGEDGKARLRGKSGTTVNGAPIANGVPQQAVAVPLDSNGEAASAPNGGDAPVARGQQGESPPRTVADRKLGALLRKLAELEAELPKDPTRKAEYDDVVAAIAAEQGAQEGHAGS
jgi:hypothetical protein